MRQVNIPLVWLVIVPPSLDIAFLMLEGNIENVLKPIVLIPSPNASERRPACSVLHALTSSTSSSHCRRPLPAWGRLFINIPSRTDIRYVYPA